MPALKETDLYAPVKRFLEGQGYEVKAEIGASDVVALRGDEPPVVVEMKTAFTLQLVFQGIGRQKLTDLVYLAVPDPGRVSRRSLWGRHYRDIVKLCRLLGLGLITVGAGDPASAHVEAHLDPGPYRPRASAKRQARLLAEFQRRVGDPNTGGTTRRAIVTAYRQDALRCARHLACHGPTKASVVAKTTGVARAQGILHRDVYGWFERVERGVYALTPQGVAGLETFADAAAALGERKVQHPSA
jgi:hypothetical protein